MKAGDVFGRVAFDLNHEDAAKGENGCANVSLQEMLDRKKRVERGLALRLSRGAAPFGIKSRRGARTISGKAPPQPKMALASDTIFGVYRGCHTYRYSPALPGHRPASQGGFRVSGASIAPYTKSGAIRPNVRYRLVRDSRQRGGPLSGRWRASTRF
jgi:hypothetical protein